MAELKKFKARQPGTISIANTAHHVMEHLSCYNLRKYPSKDELYEGLFYVGLKSDKAVVSYRQHDRTMHLHFMNLETFLEKVRRGEDFTPEEDFVMLTHDPKKSKYIGNTIYDLLYAECLIEE